MSAAIATIFGLGYLRPAPGTWGSLFALILAILLVEIFGIIGFLFAPTVNQCIWMVGYERLS